MESLTGKLHVWMFNGQPLNMGQYASKCLLNKRWRHLCCRIGNGSPERSYEINCSEEVNKHRTSAGINLE